MKDSMSLFAKEKGDSKTFIKVSLAISSIFGFEILAKDGEDVKQDSCKGKMTSTICLKNGGLLSTKQH